MNSLVVTVTPETCVADVLRLLRSEKTGAALVSHGARVLGLVTARECVFAALRYRNVAEVAVAELMYTPIPAAPRGTELAEAYASMAEHGICHLAVVDEHDGFTGLVSADDCWEGLSDAVAAKNPATDRTMTREVVTVKETDNLIVAIRAMAKYSIGCVVVERGGFPVGMLADGDIAPLIQYGMDIANILVGARMSREIRTFPLHGESGQALALMARHDIRRLVVVDRAGRVAGLLSRHDLMQSLGDSREPDRSSAAAAAPISEELARAAAEWKAIADAGEDAIVVLDVEGRVARANVAFERLAGRESSGMLGHPVEEILNSRNSSPMPRLWSKRRAADLVLAAGDPCNPFGIPVAIDCRPMSAAGWPTGNLLKIRDLSRLIHHEEQRRVWDAVLENTREGIVIAAADGNIILANHAFCGLAGYGERELLGFNLRLLANEGPAASLFRTLGDVVFEGRDWRGEVFHQGRDGKLHFHEMRIAAIEEGRNPPTHFVALVSEAVAGVPARNGSRRRFDFPSEPANLENQLRRAIERDELSLCYQPQVEIPGGRVIGIEAMVRWQRDERGLIGPADFIPTAERGGFMAQLDQWVLRRACEQGRLWLDSGVRFGRIAVNVAESHVRRHGFENTVRRVLEETGLPGSHLELDITEAILMAHGRSLAEALDALRKLGVEVAIDDFGAGSTSLALLASLPVHRLKLDRSFLLQSRVGGSSVARAAIALGRNLGLGVIAKGVEAEWQRDELLEGGCKEAQGFLYGRPASAAEITRMLSP